MNRMPPIGDVNLLIIAFVELADCGVMRPDLAAFGVYLDACAVINDLAMSDALEELPTL